VQDVHPRVFLYRQHQPLALWDLDRSNTLHFNPRHPVSFLLSDHSFLRRACPAKES
jgi:hypothetical protein